MPGRFEEVTMNRPVALLAVPVMAIAGVLSAAGPQHTESHSAYRTAYFAATVPGAWSRYAMTSDGKTESTYTYRRLPDEDGRAQIELRTDFTSGQFQGT